MSRLAHVGQGHFKAAKFGFIFVLAGQFNFVFLNKARGFIPSCVTYVTMEEDIEKLSVVSVSKSK